MKVGDYVCRSLALLHNKFKIDEVSEVLQGVRLADWSLFFYLDSTHKTIFRGSLKEPKKFTNPENFPIPDKEEISEIKQKRGAKMLQAEEKEYPVIEIKDIRAGDLVEDPFGNKLVSCGEYLYNKDGIRECFKKELKYKLIQKKKYIRPANAFFRHNGIRESSLEKKDLWFLNCARLGREPEIERRTFFIPNFTYCLASFARKDDAFNFIESQEEPQLLSMCHGSDGRFWVTKYFTQTNVELPIDDSTQESLELQLKNEKEISEELRSRIKDYDAKVDEHSSALAKEKIITSALKEQVKALKEQVEGLKKQEKDKQAKHESETKGMRESLKATREHYTEHSVQLTGQIDSLKTLLAKETTQLLEVSQKLKDITNLHEGAKHINKTLFEDNKILKENLRKREVEVWELRQKFQDLSIALNNC